MTGEYRADIGGQMSGARFKRLKCLAAGRDPVCREGVAPIRD